MPVVWTTGFLDLPASLHARGTAFWCAVAAATPSALRGYDGQFATLVPPDGDAFLRAQRRGNTPRVRVDLQVDDVEAEASRASGLGARVLLHERHVVLRSPGGFVHCLVGDGGERTRPAPVTGPLGGTARVDQVCLDVPSALLAAERAYWTGLTGWPGHTGSRIEFTVLNRPAGVPLRFMLQELGADDRRTEVTAHLDVACGPGVEAVAAEHHALGAHVAGTQHAWTVMGDPAGLTYCLTPRDPVTGLLG